MPLKDCDKKCISKKRHIGNNYVTIIYDDSEGYSFGTIKVYILHCRLLFHYFTSREKIPNILHLAKSRNLCEFYMEKEIEMSLNILDQFPLDIPFFAKFSKDSLSSPTSLIICVLFFIVTYCTLTRIPVTNKSQEKRTICLLKFSYLMIQG